MEIVMLILCLFLLPCLLLAFTINQARQPRPRNITTEPPGPRPLPLIGNLLELGAKPHKSLTRFAKTHGPLMSLKLGQVNTIVISSASMARQILQTHDSQFANRAAPDSITAHGHDEYGIAWMPPGPIWRTLRRICSLHLFSPKTLDASRQLRHQKVQELISHVDESANRGEPVEIAKVAFMAALNFLSNTIASKDFVGPKSGSSGVEFKQVVWQIMVEAGKPNLSDYFPSLKWIDPLGVRRRMKANFGQLLDVFDGIINDRLRHQPESNKNDMLDILIRLLEDNKDDEPVIDVLLIKHLFLDLFGAGSDTTSSTLEWAMAELLNNPEKLSRAQAELEKVIGNGNQVEESDVSRLPYLQAVVKETLRLHPAVPLLLPRRAMATLEVGGYTIQEGSQVLVNAWAIGRDPDSWEDPNTFKPERFIGSGSNIDVKGQHFEVIPFGGGRRICPGLPLAMKMLHLMLGSLLHSFEWKVQVDMDMEDKFGITLQKALPLRAIPMHKTL